MWLSTAPLPFGDKEGGLLRRHSNKIQVAWGSAPSLLTTETGEAGHGHKVKGVCRRMTGTGMKPQQVVHPIKKLAALFRECEGLDS
jgi:hypothetical protein